MYTLATKKLELIRTVIIPKSVANLETAKKALDAGVNDSLKFLETERGRRRAQLDALETELSVRRPWILLLRALWLSQDAGTTIGILACHQGRLMSHAPAVAGFAGNDISVMFPSFT